MGGKEQEVMGGKEQPQVDPPPVWMVCQAGKDSAGNTDSRYSART